MIDLLLLPEATGPVALLFSLIRNFSISSGVITEELWSGVRVFLGTALSKWIYDLLWQWLIFGVFSRCRLLAPPYACQNPKYLPRFYGRFRERWKEMAEPHDTRFIENLH